MRKSLLVKTDTFSTVVTCGDRNTNRHSGCHVNRFMPGTEALEMLMMWVMHEYSVES